MEYLIYILLIGLAVVLFIGGFLYVWLKDEINAMREYFEIGK